MNIGTQRPHIKCVFCGEGITCEHGKCNVCQRCRACERGESPRKSLMGPIEECIRFYTRHWSDCSGAEIACSCGLSQLKSKALQIFGKSAEEKPRES
jgi:hypothetical protein